MENWKDIEGYEGYYQVSDLGNIRNVRKNNKLMTCTRSKTDRDPRFGDYLTVGLSKYNKRKTIKVHRLVAKAFVPNPNNKPEVNHINELKYDNRAINLQWVTESENQKVGTTSQRKREKAIRPVRQMTRSGELIKIWDSGISTREGGFDPRHVASCVTGDRKTHAGYRWSRV
jgi:hypothetical protein